LKYIGIQEQIRSNNIKTIVLMLLFPILVSVLAMFMMRNVGGFVLGLIGCGIWFIIAYFSHTSMIANATGAYPTTRTENPRVYNLLENLCIAQGMPMPQLHIIEDDSLNAFASGINHATYTITLSRGIIEKLDDDELEGVLAHELTHIVNKDVRLLIVSIVFVGIISFLAQVLMRNFRRKDGVLMVVLSIVLGIVAGILAQIVQLAISRKREYMADAGAAEMTKKPYALAAALRKIAQDPYIESVERKDIAQLFMHNPSETRFAIADLFSTHPPIDKRIELLEQYV
jgi:heat shock protein HtpX